MCPAAAHIYHTQGVTTCQSRLEMEQVWFHYSLPHCYRSSKISERVKWVFVCFATDFIKLHNLILERHQTGWAPEDNFTLSVLDSVCVSVVIKWDEC